MLNRSPYLLVKLVFTTLLLCSSACTEVDNSAIRFALSAAPVTLDPRYATDAMSQRINQLIYKQLIDFDDQYHVIPALAHWEKLDPQHYRFYLGQEGRTFHSGDHLTANDVKATFDYILDNKNASPHRKTLSIIAKMEVLDKDTIDFYLKNPDPLFPGRLRTGILSEKLIAADHPFNQQPVGSGPLKFIDWPIEGDLKLQRLADQQTIQFITVKDATVRILKLLNGEVDLLQGELPQELVRWLSNKQEVSIKKARGDIFTYIGFNLQDKDTSQLEIRRAIAHALDREAIIQHVLDSSARIAGALLIPEHWAGHPELNGYEYDPVQSRQILKQLGYDQTNSLKLTYKTSNNPLRVRLATIIQFQLKQVGIDIDLNSYDWGTFYGDIKAGRFQMYSLSWVGLKMPDIFRNVFHSESVPPAGANRGRFYDVNVDALINQAANLEDLKEQAKMYVQLQELLHEQLPYIPLWYEDNILVQRKDIEGYTLAADGNYDGLITVRRHTK
jgi:peptide/nickel transport system substrate-binding protein